MLVKNLKWMWKISTPIGMHDIDRPKQVLSRIRIFKRRLVFTAKAIRLLEPLQAFIHPQANSTLQRAIEQRPEILGVVIWPYICSSWPAKTRLNRVEQHFKAIETVGSALDFPMSKKLLLLDLGEVVPDLKIVLDQPKWFAREGLLVVNLFISDIRIYSLAFSLAFEAGQVVTYVGALQGVDNEGILDDYKNLTKALHGMRPRDFLVEVFRILCRCAGICKIFAVSDDRRQHRSNYFNAENSAIFVDYNNIWMERSGTRDSGDFFVLSLQTPMKNQDEIPSKKRAMYRRRYELFQIIEERMQVTLKDCTANHIFT